MVVLPIFAKKYFHDQKLNEKYMNRDGNAKSSKRVVTLKYICKKNCNKIYFITKKRVNILSFLFLPIDKLYPIKF